jgi:PAS domain S-box-containing protein
MIEYHGERRLSEGFIRGLIQNTALLLALALVYDIASVRWRTGRSPLKQTLVGLAVGTIGLAVMKTPWHFAPGIVFDTRSVLLCVSGLFLGAVPTMIAMAMTAALRISTGGAATLTGVCVILSSGTIGLAWRRRRRRSLAQIAWPELLGLGLVVHLVMLAWMLLLPWDRARQVLADVTLPVLTVYPLATAALGALLADRLRREQAVGLLNDSERWFRTLFDQAVVGVAQVDAVSGRFLRTNERYAQMLGYSRAELERLDFPSVTHLEDRLKDQDQMRRLLAGEVREITFDKRYLRKDGSTVWVALAVSAMWGPGEQPTTNVTIAQDITERRRAEERERAGQAELRESEQKFRDLFDNAEVAMFRSRLDGSEVLDVNRKFLEIVGKTREQTLGKPSAILWADPTERAIMTRRLAADGSVSEFEFQMLNEQRGLRDCVTSLRLYPDQGILVGSIGDITERKRAEAALAESETRLRTLVQTIPDLIWLKDPDGVYLDCNVVFERFFGARKRDIVGKTDYDFVDRELADFFREHDRKAMAAGKPSVNEEWITFADDGHRALLETIKTPMSDAAGRLVGVLGIARDITERIRSAEERTRLEDQLRQLQKVEAIGRLAGGVAHDFNTLTAIVLGYGEMLLGELDAADPRRKYATEIVEAGRRSAALTRQLLAFSRKQTLQPEVIDLDALLRNFEGMLGRLLGESVELTLKPAAAPCRITADPGQIEQVVTNLAVNARDAMPLGGSLTLETAAVEFDAQHPAGIDNVKPGKYVRLTLADTGSGMDKATLDRLFEPFFTTKPRGKGTGLGLATAFGIVKQSGGHIWAASEPGRGTTFTICLPWTDALPAAKAPVAAEEVPRGRGERVLVVEDEPGLRELCASLLLRLGYRVVTAGNGPDALLLMHARRLAPDLVLTDVIMPGMSGVELARRLRGDWPGLPVLYMSGYPDDAINPHGVLVPGTPFIQKPFSEQALALKVRELLADKPHGARAGKRILMIDDDEQFRALVEHFCVKAGHAFSGVGSTPAALAALAAQPFEVLLVDLNIPGTSGERVLREIRAAGHVAPAIVLTGHVAAADMDALRPLGVVLALEKSSHAAPLLRALDTATGNGDQSAAAGTP